MASSGELKNDEEEKNEEGKDIAELLTKCGLDVDYWHTLLKDEFDVTSLYHISGIASDEDDVREILDKKRHRWEKGALRNFFKLVEGKIGKETESVPSHAEERNAQLNLDPPNHNPQLMQTHSQANLSVKEYEHSLTHVQYQGSFAEENSGLEFDCNLQGALPPNQPTLSTSRQSPDHSSMDVVRDDDVLTPHLQPVASVKSVRTHDLGGEENTSWVTKRKELIEHSVYVEHMQVQKKKLVQVVHPIATKTIEYGRHDVDKSDLESNPLSSTEASSNVSRMSKHTPYSTHLYIHVAENPARLPTTEDKEVRPEKHPYVQPEKKMNDSPTKEMPSTISREKGHIPRSHLAENPARLPTTEDKEVRPEKHPYVQPKKKMNDSPTKEMPSTISREKGHIPRSHVAENPARLPTTEDKEVRPEKHPYVQPKKKMNDSPTKEMPSTISREKGHIPRSDHDKQQKIVRTRKGPVRRPNENPYGHAKKQVQFKRRRNEQRKPIFEPELKKPQDCNIKKMRNELRFLLEPPELEVVDDETEDLFEGNTELLQLLEATEMTKYFPQKLTLKQVLSINETDRNIKESTKDLPQLPWYLLRNVLGIYSEAREECHPSISKKQAEDAGNDGNNSDSDWSDDGNSEEDDDCKTINDIHPLDTIILLYLCGDDFLRQRLANSLTKCQYAIPLIISSDSAQTEYAENQCVLIWSLQAITREYFDRGTSIEAPLSSQQFPIVSFMNFGSDEEWKITMLNRMLSDNQDHTFWHNGLAGGRCNQKLSQSLVEFAWYLPGGRETDKFQYPVVFTNLRNDAKLAPHTLDLLLQESTVTCLFVEDIDDTMYNLLSENPSVGDKIIIILLYDEEQKRNMKDKIQTLMKYCTTLKKNQFIRAVKNKQNFQEVKEKLDKAIKSKTNDDQSTTSLNAFAEKAHERGFHLDDENSANKTGQFAAQQILAELDKLVLDPTNKAKVVMLPYHGNLEARTEIAWLDKEEYRQTKRPQDISTIEYQYQIVALKWAKRRNILNKSKLSTAMKIFLKELQNPESVRKYFLQWLTMGLNERSLKLLQPLYQSFNEKRKEPDSKEKDEDMNRIADALAEGALGIEHFFREVAQIFDLLEAIEIDTACTDLSDIKTKLAEIMANVWLDGTALEVMDGDACRAPTSWISAVMDSVKELIGRHDKIFTVSVLGAQSCGKSTLLNTTFGLEFPVSSGRCTRGAFMQLVQVSPELHKTLDCHYLAVIDTEGLQSRITANDDTRHHYDNELSTFIIGMTDLTFIIIKGEGKEMQNVIPMVIHAFFQMNTFGEKQCCHFVHQNMGAVGAAEKTATEIETFVNDLNKMTKVAAKEARKEGAITKFTEILQYSSKDNTYVPGLWNGTPPMAPSNMDYSNTMKHLRYATINHIIELQKKTYTVDSLTKKIKDLWEGIRYEDFIFSFQNTLAIEAHNDLMLKMNDWKWDVRDKFRERLKERRDFYTRKQNESKSFDTQAIATEWNLFFKTEAVSLIEPIQQGIEQHFKSSENAHLIQDKKHHFITDTDDWVRGLLQESDEAFSKLVSIWEYQKRHTQFMIEGEEKIQIGVLDFVKTAKSQTLKGNLEKQKQEFERLWNEAVGDVAKINNKDEKNFSVIIEKILLELLPQQIQSAYIHMRKESLEPRFTAKSEHIELGKLKKVGKFFHLTDAKPELQEAQRIGDDVLAITEAKLKLHTETEPKPFENEYAEEIFKEASKLQQEKIKLTTKLEVTSAFEVEIAFRAKNQLEVGFRAMHTKYLKESHPHVKLCKLKETYFVLFQNRLGHTDIAEDFCNTFIKSSILSNIEKKIDAQYLARDVKAYFALPLRDMKTIQFYIMKELAEELQFKKYIRFIRRFENYVMDWLEDKCLENLRRKDNDMNRLHIIALEEMDTALHAFTDASAKTQTELYSTFDQMLDQFVKNLPTAYDVDKDQLNLFRKTEMNSNDLDKFMKIVNTILKRSEFKESLNKTIKKWGVAKHVEKKMPHKYLYANLIGCTETCPFCSAPCDVHTSNKSQDHSTSIHRPRGITGGHWIDTNRLVVDSCPSLVASGARFRHHPDGKEKEWVDYKLYKTIHKDWSIPSNKDVNVAKYWKWIFAHFQTDIADYYSVKTGDVPKEWNQFTWDNVKGDLENIYGIST